jgi:PAS domain S-box-containing protein
MARGSFTGLRSRLLLLVLIALAPALAMILLAGLEQRHRAAAEAKVEAMRLVGVASTSQRQLLEDARQLLVDLSKALDSRFVHPTECNNLLADLLTQHPQYANFGVAAVDGDVVCSAIPLSALGNPVNVSDRHYFQRAAKMRDFAVGSYQVGRIAKIFTINFGLPILSRGGEVQAVLFSALDLTHLVRIAAQAQLPEGAVLTIRDDFGTTLFRYPEHDAWVGRSFPEAPIVKSILSQQGWGTAEAAGIDGVQRLYAFAPLSTSIDPAVYLSVGIDSGVAFSIADREMIRNMIYLGIVALIAFAAAWFGGNVFIMNQVFRLMHVTRRLTAGDLTARCGTSSRGNELGELAHAFDNMAESLEQRTAQLRNAEAKYRALVEDVPAIAYVMSGVEPCKTLYVSPQVETILGFSPSEWLADSNPWVEHLHPDDRERVLAQRIESTVTKAPLNIEYRLRTRDGRFPWIRDESQIFPDDGGSFIFRGLLRDITERKLSEEAFRELSRKNELILQSAGEGIFGLDVDGNVTFMNPAAAQMIGCEVSEMLGRSHHEMVHHTRPDGTGYPRSECPIYAAFRDGTVHKASNEVFWRVDGTSFPIEYVSTPIFEENEPVGAVVCFRDITQRKLAEEELVYASEEWKRTFDAVPDLIMILDTEYKIVRVNKAMADKVGMSQEALVGNTCYTCVHGTNQPNLFCPHAQLLEDGQAHSLEVYERLLDGDYIVTVSPLFDNSGSVLIGSVHVAHNITERKNAEKERLRLEKAIEQASDIIIITDKNGFIQYVNPAFERISGYTSQEIAGSKFHALRSDRHSKEFYEQMWNDISHGRVWAGRITSRMKDGALREFETTISPIRDDSEAIVNFVSVNRDVTQEVALENQLRQAQKMEAIGTLAGGIAHDFNNILAAILGYTELALWDVQAKTPASRSLEQVRKASLRAKDLVKQILAFSRHDLLQERMPVELSLIIQEALTLLRASLPSTIEIRQNIQRGMALADSTQVHQVIVNLCTNAAHSMNDRGVIDVVLSRVHLTVDDTVTQSILNLGPGAYLKLSVSDTGHGMDGATRERIFDPYFTTKAVGEGSGLGLAVVHGILKRHEGAITVRSEAGEGTTFDVYFPMIEMARLPADEVSANLPTGSESILLVDDEKAVAELGAKVLERLGYRVIVQTSPMEALDIFRSSPEDFDLIVSDYTMPLMTGTDLATEILKIEPQIPVILCTGFTERVTEKTIRDLGIMELAIKPLDTRQLAEVVRRVLDRTRRPE